ncbi:MAG TPA: hypothetical protein VGD64_09420, partial [Acidisarcina sp.]
SSNVKEKGSLGCAFKTMRTAKGIFLADASDREGLAWEASQQDIMVRNFLFVKGNDVPDQGMVVSVVFDIGLLRPRVPLAGKYALPPCLFEANSHSAYSSEKINELKSAFYRTHLIRTEHVE